jgi:16S rRNA (uracil1498-N3)-methyltransferase
MSDRPVDSHTPPQYFVEPDMLLGNQIVLARDVLRHAKAQRLSVGETFRAVLGDTLYLAEVTEALPDRIVAEITGRTRAVTPPWKVHLLASLLKGQNFDLVVEKATEIGVASITPVVTRRTIPRLDQQKAAERRIRWQKVAKAASEQSGRIAVTEVREVISFAGLMDRMAAETGARLLAYEHEGMTVPLEQALAKDAGTREAYILIGPEGGLEAEEVERALSAGFVPVSLGPYIMKAETASIAAASLLVHYLSRHR